MIRSIDAVFKKRGDNYTIELGAIYYYTFLDDGTKYIKKKDITKDVIEGDEFRDLVAELMVDISMISINKTIDTFNKK